MGCGCEEAKEEEATALDVAASARTMAAQANLSVGSVYAKVRELERGMVVSAVLDVMLAFGLLLVVYQLGVFDA